MIIALVYPATEFDMEFHREALPNGLLSIASVVEKNQERSVDLFDPRHLGKALPEKEDINKYSVIGFTAMSMQMNHCLKLIRKVREMGFSGKLVIGGPHASVSPDTFKNFDGIDAVFIGEAEITFPLFLDWLSGGNEIPQNTWVKNNDGRWDIVEGQPYVEDLDTLPLPARDKLANRIKELKWINIFSARGCPYNCKFCQPSKRILFGRKIRKRTPESLVAEIKMAINSYGITSFSIDDDTFTFDRKAVERFCELIEPLNLQWACQTRSDVKAETLKKMRQAGCWLVFVGAESGSQKVLNLMGKNNSVENNLQFIHDCNKHGIRTWCNIILGYPGETEEDMKLTLEFVRKAKATRVCVSQATPFPGTYLVQDNPSDVVSLNYDDMGRHVTTVKFHSMEASQKTIERYRDKISRGWDIPLQADPIPPSFWIGWALRKSARPFQKIISLKREFTR